MKEKKLRVTIDMYSGRKNPVIEFSGKKLKELTERLSPVKRIDTIELDLPPIPTLGYRGLIFEQKGKPVKDLPKIFRVASGAALGQDLSYKLADKNIEDFILKKSQKDMPSDTYDNEILRTKKLYKYWKKHRIIPPPGLIYPIRCPKCKCAPVYEPEWWNVSSRQPRNNCYNYATNYRTDTFAQPGMASDAKYESFTCDEVKRGALADELLEATSNNNKCPSKGHLVALVIWPGMDFHWYRKGKDGKWSHKPGSTAVTNLDNSGNIIVDPRHADRGGYTQFCTFMIVKHGHIRIR